MNEQQKQTHKPTLKQELSELKKKHFFCYLGFHLLVLPDLAGLLLLKDVERIEDPLVVGLEEGANLGRVQRVVPDVRGHARPLLLPVHLQQNIYSISGI
jgi:hypothetical protein